MTQTFETSAIRCLIFSVALALTVQRTAADPIVNSPPSFSKIVKNVSAVFVWGLWVDRCGGDGRRADFNDAIKQTFASIDGLTNGDQTQRDQIISEALAQARGRFVKVDCDKDKDLLRTLAYQSADYLNGL